MPALGRFGRSSTARLFTPLASLRLALRWSGHVAILTWLHTFTSELVRLPARGLLLAEGEKLAAEESG